MAKQPELTPDALPDWERPAGGRGGEEKKKETLGQDLYQMLQSMVWIVLLIILLFTFVFRATLIDGESMENTLFDGEVVLTWTLGYRPKAGDVVVLTKTEFRDQSIIKRVIATEGQTVDIDYFTGSVYVDGTLIEEDYIKEFMRVPDWGEGVNHVTVPEGCIFVMGDNRNHSSDSRLPTIGMVDTRCVVGHAVLVLFPFAKFGLL